MMVVIGCSHSVIVHFVFAVLIVRSTGVPLAFFCSVLMSETIMFAIRLGKWGEGRGVDWGIMISSGEGSSSSPHILTHGNWNDLRST